MVEQEHASDEVKDECGEIDENALPRRCLATVSVIPR
jgi:hypothetical protein